MIGYVWENNRVIWIYFCSKFNILEFRIEIESKIYINDLKYFEVLLYNEKC